jgi:hypothetical protein
MAILIRLLGAAGIIAGGFMLYLAYNRTLILGTVAEVSAIQVTQVYSEANFYALAGIACFVFALLMAVADIALGVNNLVVLQNYKSR